MPVKSVEAAGVVPGARLEGAIKGKTDIRQEALGESPCGPRAADARPPRGMSRDPQKSTLRRLLPARPQRFYSREPLAARGCAKWRAAAVSATRPAEVETSECPEAHERRPRATRVPPHPPEVTRRFVPRPRARKLSRSGAAIGQRRRPSGGLREAADDHSTSAGSNVHIVGPPPAPAGAARSEPRSPPVNDRRIAASGGARASQVHLRPSKYARATRHVPAADASDVRVQGTRVDRSKRHESGDAGKEPPLASSASSGPDFFCWGGTLGYYEPPSTAKDARPDHRALGEPLSQ